MSHLFVLIGDDSLFVSDDLVAFLLLRKQVLMLLLNKRIIFLLAGLDLTVADDLVSGVLFLGQVRNSVLYGPKLLKGF